MKQADTPYLPVEPTAEPTRNVPIAPTDTQNTEPIQNNYDISFDSIGKESKEILQDLEDYNPFADHALIQQTNDSQKDLDTPNPGSSIRLQPKNL